VRRLTIAFLEIAVLSALVVATRCANRSDVFVGNEIYFTDADCYARMSRVRLCLDEPGAVVRHHAFENFPIGTVPHTTAPFDYLIAATAATLRPFAANWLDLAGAIISPILGLMGGWFLWWWSRSFPFGARWATLLLYATSPMLVHGTELGRPDHQSLLLLLTTMALCGEWEMEFHPSRGWALLSGGAWGFALWTSLYEPMLLLLVVLGATVIRTGGSAFTGARRVEWLALLSIAVLALICERRVPALPLWSVNSVPANWARTIGELQHIRIIDPIWLAWTGGFVLALPLLLWNAILRGSRISAATVGAVLASYLLALWQARWGYFFVASLVIILPALIAAIRRPKIVVILLCICFFPIARDWDSRLWPNELREQMKTEQRAEQGQLREAARQLRSDRPECFLAPWWLTPAIAYWSGQPGVAGSSHEAIDGIADSARFFLSTHADIAGEIIQKHRVCWVITYDSDRVAENSAAILGVVQPINPLGRILERTPSQVPPLLRLVYQTRAQKVFTVQNPVKK